MVSGGEGKIGSAASGFSQPRCVLSKSKGPEKGREAQNEALNPGALGRYGATPDRERSVSQPAAALARVEVH